MRYRLRKSSRDKARECYIEAEGDPAKARKLYVQKYGSIFVIIQVLTILWQLWNLWHSLNVKDPGQEPLEQELDSFLYY